MIRFMLVKGGELGRPPLKRSGLTNRKDGEKMNETAPPINFLFPLTERFFKVMWLKDFSRGSGTKLFTCCAVKEGVA